MCSKFKPLERVGSEAANPTVLGMFRPWQAKKRYCRTVEMQKSPLKSLSGLFLYN
jgi:hypothetical protein